MQCPPSAARAPGQLPPSDRGDIRDRTNHADRRRSRKSRQRRHLRTPQSTGRLGGHPSPGCHARRRRSRRRGRAQGISRLGRSGAHRPPPDADEGIAGTGSQGRRIRRCHGRRDRCIGPLGRLQRTSGSQHAAGSRIADNADQWPDHSFRRAGQLGHGRASACRRGAGHRSLECARHPGRARYRGATGLRQYRGPQGLGAVPRHPRPDHRSVAGRRPAAGRSQLRDQCARRRRRGGGGDGGAPGRAPRELHRLHAGRPHHRPDLRQIPQTGRAGAGWQGPLPGVGRCRH